MLAACLAALVLGGCAAVRFAYDNADLFLRWRANGYVDLAAEDTEALAAIIADFHAWHRANQLPKYAEQARDAARRFADGLSQDDLVWGYDSVLAHVAESLRAAAERVAPLLDRVGPDQLRHIERGFAEDDRRFAREYLRGSEEERRTRRAKRIVERLEDWVGRLSGAQRSRVQQFAERLPPQLDALRQQDRYRLQAGFLEIVRNREARERLPGFAAGWREGRDSDYVAASEVFRRELFALLLDLDRTFTPEQRARAVTRLRAYADDFEALAARAKAQ